MSQQIIITFTIRRVAFFSFSLKLCRFFSCTHPLGLDIQPLSSFSRSLWHSSVLFIKVSKAGKRAWSLKKQKLEASSIKRLFIWSEMIIWHILCLLGCLLLPNRFLIKLGQALCFVNVHVEVNIHIKLILPTDRLDDHQSFGFLCYKWTVQLATNRWEGVSMASGHYHWSRDVRCRWNLNPLLAIFNEIQKVVRQLLSHRNSNALVCNYS